jgi:hypothetical protein
MISVLVHNFSKKKKTYPYIICRSVDCFRLGWPMRADADFFCLSSEQLRVVQNGVSNELLASHGLLSPFLELVA